MADLMVFYGVGTVLVIVGLIVIILAIFLFSSGSKKEGRVRGAGVIMIGPIPVIFGTDKTSVKAILTLAVVLFVVVLIILIVYNWLLR